MQLFGSQGERSPFIGDMRIASIQQDWFRSLAGGLGCCGVVQEVAHHLPEKGALGVTLLEVKRSWACSATMMIVKEFTGVPADARYLLQCNDTNLLDSFRKETKAEQPQQTPGGGGGGGGGEEGGGGWGFGGRGGWGVSAQPFSAGVYHIQPVANGLSGGKIMLTVNDHLSPGHVFHFDAA